MTKPTLQQFKEWARENRRLAEAVCMAQAFAQCERARVDAYIKPLFELYDFYVSPENLRRGRPAERITDINLLYLTDLSAPQYLDFMEQCDIEHRKHGFKGKRGHCPALEAEHLQALAEQTLLEAGSIFGADFAGTYGEDRKKALDLFLGACLQRAA